MARAKAKRPMCCWCLDEPTRRFASAFCSLECAGEFKTNNPDKKARAEGNLTKKDVKKRIVPSMRKGTSEAVKALPIELQKKLKEMPEVSQRILAEMATGETAQTAGLLAGVDPARASGKAQGVVSTKSGRAFLRELLIANGFTDEHYAKGMYNGSMAMKSVGLVVHKFDREGKLDEAGAQTKSFVEVPDWPTRRFYYQMGGKGLGHDIDKGDAAQQEELHIHFEEAKAAEEEKKKEREANIEPASYDPVDFVEADNGESEV